MRLKKMKKQTISVCVGVRELKEGLGVDND